MLEQIKSITMIVKKPIELILDVRFNSEDDDIVAFETTILLLSVSIFVSKYSYILSVIGFT
jgi:hypothetical protein